jgi:uncharacterized tellurite resistance protein B-like protein
MSATLPLVVLVLLTVTPEAHARRGILLITTGEKVIEIADLPDDSMVKKKAPDAKIGYRCEHFGVYWMALWTWGGEFCVYSDEQRTLVVGTPAELAEATGIPESEITKPLSYTLPPLLVIIAVFLMIGLGVKIAQARDEARRHVRSLQRTSSLRSLVDGGGPARAQSAPAGGNLGPIPLHDAGPSDPADAGGARAANVPMRLYSDEELLGGALQAEEVAETQEVTGGALTTDDEALFDALMDALCCVMVSDRRVSKSEKKHVHEVMGIVRCPWTSREINKRIDEFVSQVKQGQYRRLYDGACNKLEALRGQGKERLIDACLRAVARADGTVDEAEMKVVERLTSAVSP